MSEDFKIEGSLGICFTGRLNNRWVHRKAPGTGHSSSMILALMRYYHVLLNFKKRQRPSQTLNWLIHPPYLVLIFPKTLITQENTNICIYIFLIIPSEIYVP
jgi:hypothetical protein